MTKSAQERHLNMAVTRVRRTCKPIVAVRVQPPHGHGHAHVHRFERTRYTEDDTQRAYPRANVPADPLRFATTDRAMVRAADHEMHHEVARAVVGAVDDRYAPRLQTAEQAWRGHPHRAATIWLTLWLGAPKRLPQRARQRLADYVSRQYGVRRL